MQNKNNRICPWCGEKLILVGKALDASYNDWEFGQKFTNSSNCRDAFEKDNLWSVGMSMFCEKCGVEIRLKKNPVVYIKITLFLAVIVMFLGFLTIFLTHSWLGVIIVLGVLFFAVVVLVAMIFWLLFIKKWRSNFIYYFQNAKEVIKPDVKLKIALVERHKMDKSLYPTNIFMTSRNQSNLWLELMSIKKCDTFYEALFRICKSSSSSKEKIHLHTDLKLYFEGKYVGNAKVVKVFDR